MYSCKQILSLKDSGLKTLQWSAWVNNKTEIQAQKVHHIAHPAN